MIRPSSLYRSDSRREATIEASAHNIHEGVTVSIFTCTDKSWH